MEKKAKRTDYEFLTKIGTGSYGVVYKVKKKGRSELKIIR
jgi:serine/threonine protein kinase